MEIKRQALRKPAESGTLRHRVKICPWKAERASVEMVLRRFGIELNEEKKRALLKPVIRLAEQKEKLAEADLLFLVREEMANGKGKVPEFYDTSMLKGSAGV